MFRATKTISKKNYIYIHIYLIEMSAKTQLKSLKILKNSQVDAKQKYG